METAPKVEDQPKEPTKQRKRTQKEIEASANTSEQLKDQFMMKIFPTEFKITETEAIKKREQKFFKIFVEIGDKEYPFELVHHENMARKIVPFSGCNLKGCGEFKSLINNMRS